MLYGALNRRATRERVHIGQGARRRSGEEVLRCVSKSSYTRRLLALQRVVIAPRLQRHSCDCTTLGARFHNYRIPAAAKSGYVKPLQAVSTATSTSDRDPLFNMNLYRARLVDVTSKLPQARDIIAPEAEPPRVPATLYIKISIYLHVDNDLVDFEYMISEI